MNILLIINPVSGKMKIKGKEDSIVNIFTGAGNTVTKVETSYREHGIELAQSAYSNGFDTIICCGGDGTLNEIFTGLLRSGHNKEVSVGYIPCGSTNDFADTLGLLSDPEEEASRICLQNYSYLDVGSFGDDRYFSYIATFGAFADSSYSAPQKLKNAVGHFAYILEGIKDFFHIKPQYVILTADGKEYRGTYVFASASNTKSVAGLVKLNDDIVNLEDGLFEVLLVKMPRNPKQLAEILWGATHSDFSSSMFDFFKAKDLTFCMSKDVDWSCDGECIPAGYRVKIKNLEKAIKLYK